MSYHLFQVLNVAIHVCPALPLVKANNFEDENFADGQLTAKSSKIISFKIVCTYILHITYRRVNYFQGYKISKIIKISL